VWLKWSSKRKALSLNPSTTKRKKERYHKAKLNVLYKTKLKQRESEKVKNRIGKPGTSGLHL
jgi:hypothetical protein